MLMTIEPYPTVPIYCLKCGRRQKRYENETRLRRINNGLKCPLCNHVFKLHKDGRFR